MQRSSGNECRAEYHESKDGEMQTATQRARKDVSLLTSSASKFYFKNLPNEFGGVSTLLHQSLAFEISQL